VRYDWFDDHDGTRLGGVTAGAPQYQRGPERTVAVEGTTRGQIRHTLTIAPTFSIGGGLAGVVEFRLEHSNQSVFQTKNGDLRGTSPRLAIELTSSF
jgi:hypothetical protein